MSVKKVALICQNCGDTFYVIPSLSHLKHCSMACRSDPVYRFWNKVDKGDGDGCWEWTSAKNISGYGQFSVNGIQVSAYRFSYELANGPIPDGMQVCHKCDNPGCVRPSHLFLGSSLDNRHDCMAKGRAIGPRGERQWNSKLTEVEVKAIRSAHGLQREIAEEYGVDQQTVSKIKLKKTWAHIP